jgi:hypothetical protein
LEDTLDLLFLNSCRKNNITYTQTPEKMYRARPGINAILEAFALPGCHVMLLVVWRDFRLLRLSLFWDVT